MSTSGEVGEDDSFVVVGAGSLGLSFAAALAAAGRTVTLFGRTTSVDALCAAGEVRVDGELTLRVPVCRTPVPAPPGVVCVVDDPAALPPAAGTLFATKAHHLEAAVHSVEGALRSPGAGGWVAGLQNGVVKDDTLAEAFGLDRTLGAATTLGARRVDPTRALVTGLGMTWFGELSGPPTPRTAAACAAVLAAGFPCATVDNGRGLLWAKFANAVGIFSVCVLSGVPTVELFRRAPLARAYRLMIDEVDAVARAEGVLIEDFPGLTIRSYLDRTPQQLAELFAARVAGQTGPPSYSSMAQDVLAGRPTEVEQIFGDLARRGARHGVPTPLAVLVNELISGIDLGVGGDGTAPEGTGRDDAARDDADRDDATQDDADRDDADRDELDRDRNRAGRGDAPTGASEGSTP